WLADEGAARTQFLDAYGQERARRMAASGAETEDASPILGSVPAEDSIMGDAAVDDTTAALTGQPGGPTSVIPEYGAAREAETDHDSVAGDSRDDRILGGEDGQEGQRDGVDARELDQVQLAQATLGRGGLQHDDARRSEPERAMGRLRPKPQSRVLPRNDPRRSSGQAEPERAMGRLSPPPEAPAIPAYRKDVKNLPAEWPIYNDALHERFGEDWDMRRSALRIAAAEGMRAEGEPGVCGGFRPSTYGGLKRNYARDLDVSALPDSPCDMTLDQMAVAYEAYLDDTLGAAGGPKALYAAVGPATGDAVVDALFHMGAPDGSKVIETAIEATDPSIRADDLPKNRFSPAMLSALEGLAAKGLGDEFRNNLIDVHKKKFDSPGETKRIEHFREPWP
ncbi:MAG: hypothetical protein ACKVSF_11180, partial [Alphaproteobacteria bacterium]